MGLFSGGQKTNTSTTITNVSDDSTHLVQDAYNTISSSTTDISDAFKSSTVNTISQPVSIIANGNGGAADSFDLNKYFADTTLEGSQTSSVSGAASGPNMKKLIVVAIFLVVGWFAYKRFKK